MAMMRTHLGLLVDALGETRGPRNFRKHTGWYLAGFPVGGDRRRALGQISSMTDLDRLLEDLDPAVPFPEAARRMPRGHTNGPRPVSVPDGWFADVDYPTPPAGADMLVSGG
jgi:hypothetical protein